MLLTRAQGWTVTAYEEWLANQLIYALLGRHDSAIADVRGTAPDTAPR